MEREEQPSPMQPERRQRETPAFRPLEGMQRRSFERAPVGNFQQKRTVSRDQFGMVSTAVPVPRTVPEEQGSFSSAMIPHTMSF